MSQATLNNFTKEEKTKLEGKITQNTPKLPEGWKWVKLKEVTKVCYGKGLPKEERKIDGQFWAYGSNGPIYRTDAFLVDFPTVIVGRKGSIGAVTLVTEKCWPIDTTFYLKLEDEANADFKFIYWMLKVVDFSKLAITTTKPGLNREDLENVLIPLPPLGVQRRVVARIEEITSRIKQAKKLREEALKDTEAIMQSALHQTFSNPEEKGWKWVPLGVVVESLKNGLYKPSRFYGKGYPCLRMYNIQDRRIVLENIKYLEVTPQELEGYGLLPNDILINRVNSLELVGKVALINHGIGPCTFESKNIRMRVKEDLILPSFLVYVLDSQIAREQISKLAKPIIGQATINQKDIVSLKVPIPPIEEQKHIVDRLDNLQSKVEMLKKQQEETEKEIDAMTQTVLRKTFKGEL